MPERKKDGTPLPDVIYPEETMQITVCIPKNRSYLSSFFGALYSLTYWNYWENNGTDDGKKVAAVWYEHWLSWDREMSDIECEENGMAKCCVEPVIERRIDPVTGRPQVRYDGGAWGTDPTDPALQVTRPQPPVTSGVVDTSCTAALNAYNGMLSLIADSSSNIATASTAYELATLVAAALLNVFLLVATGGIASPLVLTITGIIWGAGTAAFELGQAGFDAYWADEDTLHELKCALVENIGSDGSFTDEQYENFRTQFKFNSPSSPARDFVLTSLGVGGSAGLSVMATLGDASGGDCNDCEEPDCDATLFIPEGSPSPASIEYLGECVYRCTSWSDGGGGQNLYLIPNGPEYDPDKCAKITNIEVVSGEITGFGNSGLNHCTTGTFQFLIDIQNICAAQFLIASTDPDPFVVDVTVAPCE